MPSMENPWNPTASGPYRHSLSSVSRVLFFFLLSVLYFFGGEGNDGFQ